MELTADRLEVLGKQARSLSWGTQRRYFELSKQRGDYHRYFPVQLTYTCHVGFGNKI